MSIETLQFMDKQSLRVFVNELIKKTDLRVGERIVQSVDETSSNKQTVSAKALSEILTAVEASMKADITDRIDDHDTQLANNATAIGDLNNSQAAQDGKLNDIDTGINNLLSNVGNLTHLTIETVTGPITNITEPATDILYFQRDNETDTMWMLYIYKDGIWVNIGDTVVDLSVIWSKDEIEELKIALGIHNIDDVEDDDIIDAVDRAFAATAGGDVPVTYFNIDASGTITSATTYGKDATSIEIPETINGITVTKIGNNAFYNCNKLTTITLPNTLTEIGEYAFGGCTALTTIDIPENVTVIGTGAFYGCSSLTGIDIPAGVTIISADMFHYCSGLTSVVIPDGVTDIASRSLQSCTALTEVTIPASVTKIGTETFAGCTALTTVNYKGTEEQWGEIAVQMYNEPLTNATKVFEYTGA